MNGIEIEIKVLLGEEKEAKRLLENMKNMDPNTELKDKSSQLNHYFLNGDFSALLKKLKPMIKESDYTKLEHIINEGKKHSVRTRYMNSNSILVIKASIDDTTSSNGTARTESEVTFEGMGIDELDNVLISAEFPYQAKWSREREEYSFLGCTVCLDKNAGYGYLAEFESIIEDNSKADETKKYLRDLIVKLGFEELDQGKLEKMFAYYNENWRDYYGTNNTFTL
ncbi:MAG: hypothetical protein PHS92_01085 [Candidatus Gracilibacteria bacterium]|nr:hypothetical protein [Candidatus Gracilibacteria bacterium]